MTRQTGNTAANGQKDLRRPLSHGGPKRAYPPPGGKPQAAEYLYKMGPATQANPALLNTGPATSTQLAALQSLMLTSDAAAKQADVASKHRRPWDYLKQGIIPLLLILIVQALLSARLLWANTAFQDEALYIWAGHLELAHWLHSVPAPDFATYFSGAPTVYPPLAALADNLGGLATARLLSLTFMLGSTVLLYLTARRLFSRRVAIMSAAFFGTLGWADQLGAFATYDAMAIFLIAFSSWLVVRACGWPSETLLIIASVALTLADAAKYASALWNPIVVGLVILTATEGGWLRRLMRGVRFAIYTAGLVLIALRLAGHSYIQGIDFTTLRRQIVTDTAPLKIVDIA